MCKRNAHSAPRSVTGGTSARCEARRLEASRAGGRRYAPPWSDSAARLVHKQLDLETCGVPDGLGHIIGLLSSPASAAACAARACQKGSKADRALALSVMLFHSEKVVAEVQQGNMAGARRKAHSFMKPLWERKQVRAEPQPLEPYFATRDGPATFHAWLAADPSTEHARDINDSTRILDGVGKWRMGWLDRPGVIVYERAQGRIGKERKGCKGTPDLVFTQALVFTQNLPTALANPSDHYVVIAPGGGMRFMSVEEVARGFMIPPRSSLMRVLTDADLLTPGPAISCLGRSVHVGVARAIVLMLIERGTLEIGLTYGSAYSGIDTFAAAVEAETGGEFTYSFASEVDETVQAALLAAWGGNGLDSGSCHSDARVAPAIDERYVDLWVITANCEKHSKRNHNPNEKDQAQSVSDVWKSLEYARRRRPKVIIMENVNEASATGPLTGLLARLEGYTMEAGPLRPNMAGAPMSRDRYFWVLTRA